MKSYNQSRVFNSSTAAKYGVSTKQNNLLGSMGLNPNLNIEDEYIENLLKQIHFMSLEIKLVKEKQSKSDGNALWGVINRTGQPYITNIVESSKKYQEMKKQTNFAISRLEKQITCLANEQGSIMAQISFLQSKRESLKARNKSWSDQNSLKHHIYDEKIEQQKERLQLLKDEIQQEQQKNKELILSHQRIVNEEGSQKARSLKQAIQIENDQKIEEMMEKDKQDEIDQLKANIARLEALFAENVEYLKAKEDQELLKQKVSQFDKNIASANFEIMQLQQSIKMAEFDREKEIKQRKRTTQDFELTKIMLQQILMMNFTRKEKQSINKKRSSPDIISAQEQREKLEKSLEETKSKLVKAEELHQKMKFQVDSYNRDIEHEKQKQQNIKKRFSDLTKQNDERESQLLALNNQIRAVEDQCDRVIYEQKNSSLETFQLEKELEFLKARRQLLKESIELKEVMNGLKVEDLQRVVQKNNDLNETVSSLMSKWDQIKSFSRI